MSYLKFTNPTGTASQGIPANTFAVTPEGFSYGTDDNRIDNVRFEAGANNPFGNNTTVTNFPEYVAGVSEQIGAAAPLMRTTGTAVPLFIGDVLDRTDITSADAGTGAQIRLTISTSNGPNAATTGTRVNINDDTNLGVGSILRFTRRRDNSDVVIARVTGIRSDGVVVYADENLLAAGFVDGLNTVTPNDAGSTIETLASYVAPVAGQEVAVEHFSDNRVVTDNGRKS